MELPTTLFNGCLLVMSPPPRSSVSRLLARIYFCIGTEGEKDAELCASIVFAKANVPTIDRQTDRQSKGHAPRAVILLVVLSRTFRAVTSCCQSRAVPYRTVPYRTKIAHVVKQVRLVAPNTERTYYHGNS